MSASWSLPQSRPQSKGATSKEGYSDGRRLSGAGLNARSGYSMPGASLSRVGADVLKADAKRPNLLTPSMLLAKTHGANFGGGRSQPPQRGTTASSLWSIPSSVDASERSGIANTSALQPRGGSRSAAPGNRFYMTAPGKMQIGASDVEEATGVRLGNDQLEALRKRYQGGYARFGGDGGRFGESIGADDLRQEVFGSIVLRPGQWPKLGGGSTTASRQVRSPSASSMTSPPASMHGRQGR
jgi:hypothetical protein